MPPPTHPNDIRLRLQLQEEVPAEALHPTAAMPGRAAPHDPSWPRGASSARDEAATKDVAASAGDGWRPTLPTSRTLIGLTLLAAVPASAIAAARVIAAARQPIFGFIALQVVCAVLFVTFLVHWFRSINIARTICTLTCATTATILATPALVQRFYPLSVKPPAEYEGILAGSCVGLAIVLAALPPIFVAGHQAEDDACDVTARVALSNGVWLAAASAFTLGGAPPWLRPIGIAGLILAAGLLAFAAHRSTRDARRFGSITRGEDPRFRILAEPEEALSAPPPLVPISENEARAWLVRLDTTSPTPYRTPSTGVPVAVIPVPAEKALRRLQRRSATAIVTGTLAITFGVARAAWPGPAPVSEIAMGDLVSVRTPDGAVETTVTDLAELSRIRRTWHRFATPAPVKQITASAGGTWALATTGELLRLVADDPPLHSDASAEERLSAKRWMPFGDPTPEPIAALTMGRDHLFATTTTGEVLVWSPPPPQLTRHLADDDGPLSGPESRPRWWHVEGLHHVAALAADGLACALHRDGRVSCWIGVGNSALGQGRDAPRTVVRGPDVTQIAAGRAHACALHEDATVHCWGDNTEGQLGRSLADPGTGIGQVEGLEGAVEIHARGDVTCARTPDLRVWCWGPTERGVTDPGPREAPREVADLPDVVRFEVDEKGVCGVRPDGMLACFPRRTASRDTVLDSR